jgi:hypothetical protein
MAAQECEARVEAATMAVCRGAQTTPTRVFFHAVPREMELGWAGGYVMGRKTLDEKRNSFW